MLTKKKSHVIMKGRSSGGKEKTERKGTGERNRGICCGYDNM
jgi:hypothetical protein